MEFIGATGKKIVINAAPFADVMELKNAIGSRIKSSHLELLKTVDIKKADVSPFLETILAVDSSKRVNKAIMKCLVKSTYDSEKISEATFEKEEARQDYYEIIIACLKVNLAPFIKGLISRLNGIESLTGKNILKQS